MSADVHGTVWPDWQVDLIVTDYFDMLADEIAGRPYNKAEHNRSLQALTRRNHASVEFKHCNITAVLEQLGIRGIRGYRARPNFQNALIDGVERFLTTKGQPVLQLAAAVPELVAEAPALWIGPPPELAREEQRLPERLRQLVRKFDPAERDARNRNLGKHGEEMVFMHEQQRLKSADRADLARKVEWTSEVRGDGTGYDIRSFELDGRDRLIEVKTTNGPAKTPFFLSENERWTGDERADVYCLLRLYNFVENPSAFELKPPWSERLELNAINYRATLI